MGRKGNVSGKKDVVVISFGAPMLQIFSFGHVIAFLVHQMNSVLPLPVLYIVFDLFYTLIHWALHIKAIYGYIHKHHHHQKAPRYSLLRVLVD